MRYKFYTSFSFTIHSTCQLLEFKKNVDGQKHEKSNWTVNLLEGSRWLWCDRNSHHWLNPLETEKIDVENKCWWEFCWIRCGSSADRSMPVSGRFFGFYWSWCAAVRLFQKFRRPGAHADQIPLKILNFKSITWLFRILSSFLTNRRSIFDLAGTHFW